MLNNKTKTVQNIEIHGNDVVIINGIKINNAMMNCLKELIPGARETMSCGVLNLMSHAVNNPPDDEFVLSENFAYLFSQTMDCLIEMEFLNRETE